MYRIAMSRLLVIMRLVIIVSLVGYTFSNANAAMHGASFSDFAVTAPADSSEAGMSGHDHAHDGAISDEDGESKLVKQECCKDFCGGFGIICDSHDVGGPVVTSIRQFVDDRRTYGELPALNRPPNI